MERFHWADAVAEQVIKEKGNKEKYVCASGISPSGNIHIGNFREIITTDLVVKALEDKGKKVRFIYSWDDFDRFRKTPQNLGKNLDKYIGMPLSKIPDPFGNCHKSYAEHFERELEDSIKDLGFKIEFIRQSEMYERCKYAKQIKEAMNSRDKIIKILNKYREEPLREDWYPIRIYCERCWKDVVKVTNYDGEFTIEYECKECNHKGKVNFSKKGVVKLIWRCDWAARWRYEKVDFEPGGKEHSTPGGSYDTAKEIVRDVWGYEPPVYQRYDFIIIKGAGGKMSGSLGNVILPKEVLEIYEPRVLRWLFVGTRPNKEFAISFDLDVIKNYEDYDKTERVYFGKEEISKSDAAREKRFYELSFIGKQPKEMPVQAGFRHLTLLVQIFKGDIKKVLAEYDIKDDLNKKLISKRAECALNWIEKYAPEEMKFELQDEVKIKLAKNEKEAMKLLLTRLKKNKYKEEDLFEEFYNICKEAGIKNTEFFKVAYNVLIDKDKGPRLAPFILAIGQDKVIKLLEKIK